MAPPVMPLHCEAALRFSSSFHDTTYTRTGGFCFQQIPDSAPGGTQNPPVLLTLEKVCSVRKRPLSSVSGRQRYNTLDFARKVVCHETAGFFGFFRPRKALPPFGFLPPRQRRRLWKPLPRVLCPLWIPQPTGRSPPLLETQRQRNCRPFGIPARFEMSTHKGKMVYGHSVQNANNPQSFIR